MIDTGWAKSKKKHYKFIKPEKLNKQTKKKFAGLASASHGIYFF